MVFRAHCRDCKKTGVYLSHKRLCLDCSMKRQVAVGMQIKERKGPYFKKYKAAMTKFLNDEDEGVDYA